MKQKAKNYINKENIEKKCSNIILINNSFQEHEKENEQINNYFCVSYDSKQKHEKVEIKYCILCF